MTGTIPPDEADEADQADEPAETASGRWVEPTAQLTLRWGGYRARWVTGLALIITGTGLVQLTSAYSLPFVLIGVVVQAAGWVIQPTTVGRRVAAFLPALATSMALLSGPGFSALMAVPLGCWLLVRLRPALSWVALALPLASGMIVSRVLIYYGQDWLSLLIAAAVSVLGAWVARTIAKFWEARQSVSRESPPLR